MLGARLDELSQSANPPFLRAAADRGLFPTPTTRDEAVLAGARLERWRGARSRRARDRAPAGRAVRLHRDRARPREAGDDARLRARGDGKPGPRVREPRRRVHAEFSRGRSAADDLAGARVPPAVRPGYHAGRGQRAHRGLVPRPEPAGCRRPRRKRPASSCPIEAQLAAVVKTASAKRLEALRGRRGGAGADGRAAHARHDREDDGPSGGRNHRVDAVERRNRRAQADHAEGRSDPVPRLGAGRDIAGERRRFHSRSRRRTPSSPPAASGGSAP